MGGCLGIAESLCRSMHRVFCLACVLGFATPLMASARSFNSYREGFVPLASGENVFYRIHEGRPDVRPIVLLNGLTADLTHWEKTVRGLLASDATILTLDGLYQGRTLVEKVRKFTPSDYLTKWLVEPKLFPHLGAMKNGSLIPAVSIQRQADVLLEVLEKLEMHEPVNLAGLSYGAAWALVFATDHPEKVKDLVLISPAYLPVKGSEELIGKLVRQFRTNFFWLQVSDKDLISYLYRTIILTQSPMTEPTVLKWGPLQLVAAAEMTWGLANTYFDILLKKLEGSQVRVHQIQAGHDQYVDPAHLEWAWSHIPEGNRGTWTVIQGVEHKINESIGPLLGELITGLTQDQKTWQGKFSLTPRSGKLVDAQGTQVAQFQPSNVCEHLFLQPNVHPTGENHPVDRIQRWPLDHGQFWGSVDLQGSFSALSKYLRGL